MTQIIETNKTSKCMYCGSAGYGKGCPYSPHHTHIHVDDSKRCIYCGSTSFGVGCPYNPFSRIHVHGMEYNQMIKESIHKSFSAGIFLSRLLQPIIETYAYKLGIIDKQGRKIRELQTEEDKNAFTPLDAYIFKLRRLVSEETFSLLNPCVIIELLSTNKQEKFDSKLYEQEIKLKNKVENLVKDYKNIIQEGVQVGITVSTIENLLIQSFLEININDD